MLVFACTLTEVVGDRTCCRLASLTAWTVWLAEPLLGAKVYLDLRVKVLKEWQRDPRALERLGF